MTSRDIDDLARQVVGWANENEHVEAYVGCSRDIDVVVHGSEVESLSSAEIGGVGIRVVRDGKQGFAFAGSFDETVLRETLIDARDNASFATYDEFGGLAEPDGVEPADLDLWRPQLTATSTDRKVDLALELEKLTMCGDARVRSVRSASYGDSMTESAIASTDGIDVSSRRSTCYIVANAIAGSADDTQTGTGYSVGRSVDDLDVQQAADDAAQRATRLLGATQPASSRVSVIFDPTVTPALLGILASTLNGELVLKGRSLFAGRSGETVASSSVTLLDDPTVAEAFGAARYDSEGLACRRNVLIDNGVLQGFLYNSYAARRAGARSTGSAVRAGYKSTPGVGSRAIVLSPGRTGC